MSISVCPLATIHAPVERVWSFLSEPANYGLWWDAQTRWSFFSEPAHHALWWDAQTRSIVPEGSASAGQKIYAQTTALGKHWNATVTVEGVDEAKRQIDLTTVLPWGITVHNHITCLPLDPAHCRVSFG
jgi:ligand-binding SRPBCC domain-containing protein